MFFSRRRRSKRCKIGKTPGPPGRAKRCSLADQPGRRPVNPLSLKRGSGNMRNALRGTETTVTSGDSHFQSDCHRWKAHPRKRVTAPNPPLLFARVTASHAHRHYHAAPRQRRVAPCKAGVEVAHPGWLLSCRGVASRVAFRARGNRGCKAHPARTLRDQPRMHADFRLNFQESRRKSDKFHSNFAGFPAHTGDGPRWIRSFLKASKRQEGSIALSIKKRWVSSLEGSTDKRR